MKTDVIAVSNNGDQISAVLNQTEKAAVYAELSGKEALHLRLLSEEMMSMMRAIAGDADGKFWIESENGTFELHLQVYTNMDYFQREKLLGASSSGKNEAYRGLMGKIRFLFEPAEGTPAFFDVAMDGANSEMMWSLSGYQSQLERYVEEGRKGAGDAWDELEKSVIAHIADAIWNQWLKPIKAKR